MNRVTIICCYNNEEQLKEFSESLDNQTEACDRIFINNIGNKFKSCSSALNYALKQVKTEYVIFSHQDIILNENNMLEKFVDYLESTNQDDIVGVAGAGADTGFITNIKQSKELKIIGKIRVKNMVECDTVDECFFGGYTAGFLKNPFDEKYCNNWHLYAVERCLNAITNNNKVYVSDIPLVHVSGGKINHAYNINFYKLSKKYSKKIDSIHTTCLVGKTNFWGRIYTYLKSEIKILLNKY